MEVLDFDIDKFVSILRNNFDKINWYYLSLNPYAIEILEENPEKIHWEALSSNPAAIHLLKENPYKIDMRYLSSNPAAIEMIENVLKMNNKGFLIDWFHLCENPAAIHIIKEYLEKDISKIAWSHLCLNPEAISILEANPDEIDWDCFSENMNAIPLLEQNPDNIEWVYVYDNPLALNLLTKEFINPTGFDAFNDFPRFNILCENPAAIHLINEMLEVNPERIGFENLSFNYAALHILEKNIDKIAWNNFCGGNIRDLRYKYWVDNIKPSDTEFILK
jgi:uncharacterized protein YlzI (FlbEa/FlbD family)